MTIHCQGPLEGGKILEMGGQRGGVVLFARSTNAWVITVVVDMGNSEAPSDLTSDLSFKINS